MVDDVEVFLYTQKNGIFIGSSVAPVLSRVLLKALDNKLSTFLGSLDSGLAVAARYVDDIVICSTNLSPASGIKSWL